MILTETSIFLHVSIDTAVSCASGHSIAPVYSVSRDKDSQCHAIEVSTLLCSAACDKDSFDLFVIDLFCDRV
jgi:hypothetical protein